LVANLYKFLQRGGLLAAHRIRILLTACEQQEFRSAAGRDAHMLVDREPALGNLRA
jgi:hypothetical protein